MQCQTVMLDQYRLRWQFKPFHQLLNCLSAAGIGGFTIDRNSHALVLCNRYGLPIAARSLGEFQEASKALPRKRSGLAERVTPKFAQRTAARRVELKRPGACVASRSQVTPVRL